MFSRGYESGELVENGLITVLFQSRALNKINRLHKRCLLVMKPLFLKN